MAKIREKKESQGRITGWRLWLFRFIAAIFIPVLLISALEFGLRLAGFGYQAKAIINCKVKGQKAYCDNVRFGWLFFPPNIAREFNPFVIPAKKSEDTYRIFVFGSSAAQGVPDSAYSFSRILDCLLSEQYPEVHFEVINTSMTAINSHVVVKIAKDCARYKPDLFVVYMGNNEIVGPYGAGTVFAPLSENLSFIRFGIALRGTRLGQLLTNLLQAANREKPPQFWGGLGMFLDKQVSAEDQRLQVVYNNYKGNLETVIEIAQKRKVPVILTTVGSNIKDCPPFASLHRTNLTEDEKRNFETLYKQGQDYDKAGQYAQALEKHLAAADIDDEFAELQFCLGRLYFLSGQYDEAKQRYIKARELDTIRLRADSRINRIIRETVRDSGSEGVYLADAVKALEEQSPQQIPGEELFYEHVHLNFRGNYILAKTVYEQIEKILPDRIKGRKLNGQGLADEAKCMQLLVYSDWNRYTIAHTLLNEYITHPPFTNQLYHQQHVDELKQQISSLKNNLSQQVLSRIASDYRAAIEKRPADWMLHWNYGKLLTDGLKDYRLAVEEYETILELVPYHMAHVKLGTSLGYLGNYDKALEHFNKALKIQPTYAPAYYDMGLIYQKRKKMVKEAQSCYENALRINPEHYPSYINLGTLLADTGRVEEAIKLCQEGLEYFPDSADLHYNLGCFLSQNGQKDEAIKEFRQALKIDPNQNLAKRDLETILKGTE